MWPGYGAHMAWMGVSWIFGLALLVWLVWAITRTSGSPHRDESPETILKSRYARGDIEREEYERRLADLRK